MQRHSVLSSSAAFCCRRVVVLSCRDGVQSEEVTKLNTGEGSYLVLFGSLAATVCSACTGRVRLRMQQGKARQFARA